MISISPNIYVKCVFFSEASVALIRGQNPFFNFARRQEGEGAKLFQFNGKSE